MYTNDEIDRITEMIKNSKHTILLTGAGMSTGSGIPDFRSETGLYSKYPDDVLSRTYFYNKTDMFYEAFHEKFSAILKAEPNEGHQIIAKWQQQGYIKEIATQNIDNLHSKAIEPLQVPDEVKDKLLKNIYEIHGTIGSFTLKARGKSYRLKLEDVLNEEGKIEYKRGINGVEGTYRVKPDIVLFGERPLKFGKVSKIVSEKVDLMIIAGTSLMVYPFADLPSYMRRGKNIIVINKTHVNLEGEHVVQIKDDITTILSEVDKRLNPIKATLRLSHKY